MTEAEARHAAATFEFPHFRAEARQAHHWQTGELVWALAIYDDPRPGEGMCRLLESPEEWMRVYQEMQEMGDMSVTRADVARWWIANAYHVLDARQQEVLILRFGLFGEPEHNLKQTGDKLRPRATAEHVRFIETGALRTLRETYLDHFGDAHE